MCFQNLLLGCIAALLLLTLSSATLSQHIGFLFLGWGGVIGEHPPSMNVTDSVITYFSHILQEEIIFKFLPALIIFKYLQTVVFNNFFPVNFRRNCLNSLHPHYSKSNFFYLLILLKFNKLTYSVLLVSEVDFSDSPIACNTQYSLHHMPFLMPITQLSCPPSHPPPATLSLFLMIESLMVCLSL